MTNKTNNSTKLLKRTEAARVLGKVSTSLDVAEHALGPTPTSSRPDPRRANMECDVARFVPAAA